MNKKQERIAEQVLKCLKDNDGILTDQQIYIRVPEVQHLNRFCVFGGLQERKLIRGQGDSSFALMEAGWDFKSFSNMRWNKKIDSIKENISFIINILLIAATIYLTTVNNGLSSKNDALAANITELQVRLSLLENSKNYQHPEPEKPPTETNQ